tara:strand:+ start:5269 stop:5748 length:480 start_codon:yes stop_codon:yes gene_type:complete
MRVVKTEQFRNKPAYKSEMAVYLENPATTKTRMTNWRGGQIEFALGSQFESVSNAPWYVIKLTRRDDNYSWYWWLDYAGPPEVYLTKTAASYKAKELRKQYKGTYKKIEVVKIGEIVNAGRELDENEIKVGRSSNYWQMSPQDQWDEDKRLGILDWDGK